MKGRKPKPTALKRLAGQPVNGEEPQFASGEAKCPNYLTRLEKRYWRVLAPVLQSVGLLTDGDHPMLALTCNALSIWHEASRQLAKEELTITLSNGVIAPNPLIGIVNKSRADAMKLLAEFGLSPTARARVTMVPEEDAFDELMAFLNTPPPVPDVAQAGGTRP